MTGGNALATREFCERNQGPSVRLAMNLCILGSRSACVGCILAKCGWLSKLGTPILTCGFLFLRKSKKGSGLEKLSGWWSWKLHFAHLVGQWVNGPLVCSSPNSAILKGARYVSTWLVSLVFVLQTETCSHGFVGYQAYEPHTPSFHLVTVRPLEKTYFQ